MCLVICLQQRWPQLFGQNVPLLKWSLAVFWLRGGEPCRQEQYLCSGIWPSSTLYGKSLALLPHQSLLSLYLVVFPRR